MTIESRRALWLEIAIVGGVVVLAGVLRMGWPGVTEFKADEARLYVLALEMAQGQFAWRGISSSVGFPNFPMSVWLYSLPLLVWPHPYSATLFTGLLNTLSLVGAYWLVRRYWGRTAALAALFMLAISPWAVVYSRKIWAQNLLPLFVMVWGLSAALAFVEGRRNWLILHLVSLAIVVQIHLAAVALLPATVLFFVVFRRRVSWTAAAVGAGLALLTAAPFLVYLVQSGTGLPSVSGGGGSEALSIGLSADSLRFTTMISTGSDIHSLAGPLEFQAYLDRLLPMLPVYLLWGALILAGVVWASWQVGTNWSDRRSQMGLILLAWLVAPVVVFALTWTESFPHYFIATYPAQYLIAGVAFAAGLERIGRCGKAAGWAVLLVTLAAQLFAWLTLLSVLATRATPGAFGIPLSFKLAAADAARMAVQNGATEVIIAGEGSSPRVDAFPAEYDALLYDAPRRFVDLTAEALFPAGPAVVLADGRLAEDGTITVDLYQTAAVSETAFPLREGEGALYLFDLPGTAAPLPQTSIEAPSLLANWARLIGADWSPRPGDNAGVWQLHWTPGDNPDPATYHIFAQAVGEDGGRVAQDDRPAFDGSQWQPGDVVISRFRLQWPDAANPPQEILTGMYRLPALEAVPVLDVAANPAGESILVPLPSHE